MQHKLIFDKFISVSFISIYLLFRHFVLKTGRLIVLLGPKLDNGLTMKRDWIQTCRASYDLDKLLFLRFNLKYLITIYQTLFLVQCKPLLFPSRTVEWAYIEFHS